MNSRDDKRGAHGGHAMTDRAGSVGIPVLIVGGGPIGLALAADLGRRGVAACWSRRMRTSSALAKMLEVSVRTMEFCRQLGIVVRFATGAFRSTSRSTMPSSPTCRATRSAASACRRSTSGRIGLQPRTRSDVPANLVRSDIAGPRAFVPSCHDPPSGEVESSCRISAG